MATGLEGEDKTSFLAKAMLESLPTGARLSDMTTSFLRSPDGIKMVLVDSMKTDCPEIEKELDITTLLIEEKDKINTIVQFAIGRSGKKPTAPFAK